MTDPAADAIAKAQLLALVDKLKRKTEHTYAELHNFFRLVDVMKEIIEHPPHTDAAAYRQHITDRINGACEILDRMRELLPPKMRIES